jgi:predicted nucleic acid-binding protein
MIVGLDTNIICYALDEAYPEHKELRDLLLNLTPENKVALNPTTLHEAYHTLVFGQKWVPQDAGKTLKMLLLHPHIEFFNQTKKNCILGLNLSVKHNLGGRDALIIANFLTNKVPVVYTHDQELLKLKKLSWKTFSVTFKDPLTQTI